MLKFILKNALEGFIEGMQSYHISLILWFLSCVMSLHLTIDKFLHVEMCHTMRYQELFLHGFSLYYNCMSLNSCFRYFALIDSF